MNFFRRQEISFVNFDFKNECQNEYEDNKEKLCSRFKNRVPLKIDFRADWTHESISTAWVLILVIQLSDDKVDGSRRLNSNYFGKKSALKIKFLVSLVKDDSGFQQILN